MRTTQRKGDIATTRAIASFTAVRWDVSIPVTESAAYDLVVDTGDRLVGVQCKFASTRSVGLRRIHSNSGGYVVKRLESNAYAAVLTIVNDGSGGREDECGRLESG